jgi:hypothetical protein
VINVNGRVRINVGDTEIAYELIMEDVYNNLLENTVINEKERCMTYIQVARDYRKEIYNGSEGTVS